MHHRVFLYYCEQQNLINPHILLLKQNCDSGREPWSTPSHHRNTCRNIANSNLRNNLQSYLKRNSNISNGENPFEMSLAKLGQICLGLYVLSECFPLTQVFQLNYVPTFLQIQLSHDPPMPIILQFVCSHIGVNTMRPRQMDAITQTTFSNAFSCMKMLQFRLYFDWTLLLWV